MRINLSVPFADNAQVKALGGRWDPARRTWYVVDPDDVAPLLVWIKPDELLRTGGKKKPRVMSKPGVSTPRTDFSLPDCGCVHEPPWADCAHTEPELDGAELAHIRSI